MGVRKKFIDFKFSRNRENTVITPKTISYGSQKKLDKFQISQELRKHGKIVKFEAFQVCFFRLP